MPQRFARRIERLKPSLLRELMKARRNADTISFAGGLPHPALFPAKEMAAAAQKVLLNDGANVLQYSLTEGYLPLREFISARYKAMFDISIDPAEILITSGSQQALDLVGKILLDPGDEVAIEKPGYMGAIQSLGFYEPVFQPVALAADGVDTAALEQLFRDHAIRFFYGVPSFQNPSGATYSDQNRQTVAHLLKTYHIPFIEDNPYGELRYSGQHLPPIWKYAPDQVLLLGSFSKIVSPGLRLGWICAKDDIMEKLIIAKQGADLHSSIFAQRVLYQYLSDNDLASHVEQIKQRYKKQRDLMAEMIDTNFPDEVTYHKPDGGMFLWCSLPEHLSAQDLFDYGLELNVLIIPGQAFYVDGTGGNTFRLSFSFSSEAQIETGMKRLAEGVKLLLAAKQ